MAEGLIMANLEVWTGSGARAAIPGARRSSESVLELLGFGPVDAASGQPSSLGDALADVAHALGLSPNHPVLAWAHVEEGVGSEPLGTIRGAATDDELAALARAAAGRVVIVPDADRREDSLAERLRMMMDATPADAVVGVVSLGDACDRAFDLRARALAGMLVPEDRRDQARVALFTVARARSAAALDWALIADLAVGLLGCFEPGDERASFELGFVRDVARRHTGDGVLLAWPSSEELSVYDDEAQLEVLAHVVQSAADASLEDAHRYAERARCMFSERGRRVGSLKLLGAAGRALAAVGAWDAAAETLREALDGWRSIDRAQSSYALCELLRVEGIRGDAHRMSELQVLTADELWKALPVHALPYVALALGRAHAQVGAWELARRALASEQLGAHAPTHVRTAVYRWRAVVARACGDEAAVADAMTNLARLGPSDQLVLAQLDAEPGDARATQARLDELLLLTPSGAEARRILARVAPGASTRALSNSPEALRSLRREYRY